MEHCTFDGSKKKILEVMLNWLLFKLKKALECIKRQYTNDYEAALAWYQQQLELVWIQIQIEFYGEQEKTALFWIIKN